MAAKGKSFNVTVNTNPVENAADAFIDKNYGLAKQAQEQAKSEEPTQPAAQPTAPRKKATTSKAKVDAKEGKTRRLQLLLKPSLHDLVKAKAEQERRSVNDYINLVLEAAVGENGK